MRNLRGTVCLLAMASASFGCRDVALRILGRADGGTEVVLAPPAASQTPEQPAPVAKAPEIPEPSASAPLAQPPVLSNLPDIAGLVEKVGPAVVNITVTEEVAAPSYQSPFDFFFGEGHGRRRGPPSGGDRTIRRQALGSGFISDAAGHVVTNAHVVEHASTVRVKLLDEREFRANVRGRDPKLDVAVLELVNASNLPVATLGSSSALRVGDYVVAIGNPFGLGHTVTMGIVSAKGRAIGAGPYDDFIQIDAAINPGNSGGPLFNLRGEVVGINTAINPAGQGIGFAIPIDDAKEVLPQLLASGHVSRGRLGVAIQATDETTARALGLDRPRGALIAEVESNGPAAKAGLRPGDVILAVDGAEVRHPEDLPRMVAQHAPGAKVNLKVLRDKREISVTAALGELPEEEPARGGGPKNER